MSYKFYTICRITEVDLGNNKIKVSSTNDMSVRIGGETYNVFVKENTSRNFTISEAFLIWYGSELLVNINDFLKQQILEAFHRDEKVKLYLDKSVVKIQPKPLLNSSEIVTNLVFLKNNE